jgi:hypothetical protein
LEFVCESQAFEVGFGRETLMGKYRLRLLFRHHRPIVVVCSMFSSVIDAAGEIASRIEFCFRSSAFSNIKSRQQTQSPLTHPVHLFGVVDFPLELANQQPKVVGMDLGAQLLLLVVNVLLLLVARVDIESRRSFIVIVATAVARLRSEW